MTLGDIEKFEKEYRGSYEDREDLKKACLEAEGNMGQTINSVMRAR